MREPSLLTRSRSYLGHDKLETTARYTRVATGMIAAIESPLEALSLPKVRFEQKGRRKRKGRPPSK